MKTLVIDGENLFKIGFFGAKNLFFNGIHIGGIYHFLNTIRKHIDDTDYDRIIVFWDGTNNVSLRKDIYPFYKENRRGRILTEHEIQETNYQRTRIKQYLEEAFVRQGEFEHCESDDCISYYCLETPEDDNTIISADADLTQLISERIRIYNPKISSYITHNDKVLLDGISVPHQNVLLVKVLCGDSGDNISGVKSMGVNTLLKFFPQITERIVSLEEILSLAEELNKTKPSRVLANLITGTSKHGVFGEEFFRTNQKIVDLTRPILTDDAKTEIKNLIELPLEQDERGWKNIMRMMMEDGLFSVLPKSDEGYIKFITPFIRLSRKEKKLNTL